VSVSAGVTVTARVVSVSKAYVNNNVELFND
jgi:hypothetical protein